MKDEGSKMRKIEKVSDERTVYQITSNIRSQHNQNAILAQINANFRSIVKCVTILIRMLLFKCFGMELNFGAADFRAVVLCFPIVIMLKLEKRKHSVHSCMCMCK